MNGSGKVVQLDALVLSLKQSTSRDKLWHHTHDNITIEVTAAEAAAVVVAIL